MRKYRFKEEFKDAQIAIPGFKVLITNFNLTDDLAQMVLKKFPRFSHNIETIPAGETHNSWGPVKAIPKKLEKYSTSTLKQETKTGRRTRK